MASKRITAPDSVKVYRGPARKKSALFGSPTSFVPVPISRMAARIEPQSGILAQYSPGTSDAFRRYNIKAAGAF
jgi:hypothetical protein